MERFELVDAAAATAGGEDDDDGGGAAPADTRDSLSSRRSSAAGIFFRKRFFSEAVDIGNALSLRLSLRNGGDDDEALEEEPSDPNEKVQIRVQSKPTQHTSTEILAQYAYSQYVCALVGGFAMTPSIGPSSTMYALGAESIAPQLFSVVFLSVFYFTNFQMVVFIPKPAFSSVLILAFIDIMDGWFIKSYQKTKNKVEWLVNPFIVATAFGVGLLSSVFLGIAMSTFFFVASFYQSGVVKYAANAAAVRSTIERELHIARWLDTNGDLLQILVLQSYLFFGNATSVLNYVSSMFEGSANQEVDGLDEFTSPFPKIIILDFSLVPGMDSSAVDVMADLLAVCSRHDCKLFLSGISPSMQRTLQLGGVEPDKSTRNRAQKKLRMFPDLDSAVGKAEDLLINVVYWPSHEFLRHGGQDVKKTGFLRCLSIIDEQHGTSFEKELAELGSYTKVVIVRPRESLYEDHDISDRGIFFIEEGIMRIERSSDHTRSLSRSLGRSLGASNAFNGQAKSQDVSFSEAARQFSRLNASKSGEQTFRLARIGPGWVVGDHEALSGLVNPGTVIAVDFCRLHYISFKQLDELEKENPLLILKLYKLLSKLHAMSYEVTIGQLATLQNIMSAPAHNRPLMQLRRVPSTLDPKTLI